LVYWHDVSPTKALFFSLIASLRNFWAFTVYSLVWLGLLMAAAIVAAFVATLMDSPDSTGIILYPLVLIITAMFFTSLYFTFRDCFEAPTELDPAQ